MVLPNPNFKKGHFKNKTTFEEEQESDRVEYDRLFKY